MKTHAIFTVLFLFLNVNGIAQTSFRDFKRLLKMFPGEYQTTGEATGTPSEQQLMNEMKISVIPIDLPQLGENCFYVKYLRGNGSLYRQRIYTLHYSPALQSITSESVGFVQDSLFIDFHKNPAQLKALSAADLKQSLDCYDTWHLTKDGFVAKMDSCLFKSERRGKDIYIYSRMMVSSTGLATTEAGKDETGKILFGKLDGYALQLRRVSLKK